jgi:hypothetical protein
MTTRKLLQRISATGLFVYLFLQTGVAHSQVYGCKDPAANNYNPSATVNDGSCTYNTTSYTPPIEVDPISNVLVESSGLQWAGNSLWSFNDGGGAAAIYRIDTASNALLQTVNLGGASNVDWEDITFDGTYFYVGDFGNNANGARTDLKIYKFPLSAIPDYATNATVTIPVGQIEVINFTYSDQTQPPVATGGNNTKYDCEAMIVDGGKIHLFTKNWIDVNTTHYVINSTAAGTYVATPLETLATGYLVTAADKAPGANVIVLLGYQVTGFGNHFMHLLSDYSSGLYFNGNKRRIDLPTAGEMGQAEGITFRNDTYGYISNEYFTRTSGGFTITVQQKLRSFNTTSFVSAYVLPLQLKNFSVVKSNGANLVSWNFATPVKNLKVQYSANRADFTTVQTYTASANGSFSHQPSAAFNCYRLAWKGDDGAEQYSDVVCVQNNGQTAFSNLLLRSNGELSFLLNGSQAKPYHFRLITTDGKLIAQTAQQIITPGANKISFSKNLSRHMLLLLQVVGEEENKSLLLPVE